MIQTKEELPIHQNYQVNDANRQAVQDYPFISLFRFANGGDWIMMSFGILGSFGTGAAIPLFVYILVDFNQAFTQSATADLLEQSLHVFLRILYLGIGTLVSAWMMLTFWIITGARQVSKCRKQYLQSLMNQQIGYFDCVDQSQLSVKFSMDMLVFQQALGQKMGLLFQIIGCFCCTLVISFSRGWLLSLIIAASLLLIIISSYFNISFLQQKQKKFLSIYTEAGGKAAQVIASIKTVKQLNGQAHEEKSYQNSLRQANNDLMKFCLKIAIIYGLLKFSIFIFNYIGFWQGSNCIEGNSHCPLSIIQNTYTVRDVLTVFFSFYGSCFTFSQLTPAIKRIGEAKVAAQRIFQMIDRVPKVRNPENGLKPEQFQGYFQLKNVTFAYPKNKSAIILSNISIKFDILRTALGGDSGCGKSTILQLLMRFYDPDKGSILLDGIDIRQIDLYWLRSKIGYVGQQPVLFSGSIRDNLLMGNSNATSQEINDALKQAEAYQFVYNQLDQKLETFVGAGGGQISGGQKQRIAIARALLKRPKILLLDQATSALDRRNEKLIQDTFDKISQKLTTITVAHRIRTIINSNIIYVIKQGSVQQSGSFVQLKKYKDYEQRDDKQEQEKSCEYEYKQKKKFVVEQLYENKNKNIDESSARVLKSLIRIQPESIVASQSRNIISANEEVADKQWSDIFGRIFSYNKDQMGYFIAAIIISIAVGGFYPIFSIVVAKMIIALRELQAKDPSGREDADKSALVFAILAVVGFAFYLLQSFIGNMIAYQITRKLRLQTFEKYLKMPIRWFDRPNNSSNMLSVKLSTDCQAINGVTSTFIFVLADCLTSVIVGFTMAFIYQWKITLVAICLIPLIALAGASRNFFIVGLSKKVESAHKVSQQMIPQSLIHIRTIISLNAQSRIISKYQKELQSSYNGVVRTGVIAGLMNGISIIFMYSIFGLLLYIGAVFIANYNVQLPDLLTAIFQCFFVGFTIGNNMQYLPDMSAAKISAIKIFNILDQEDEEQIQIKENSKMLKEGINGDIKFQNICFQYEGRVTKVFEDLNFQIKKGEKVAFVGPSGCGKSTIIQLLQRFYFPQKGKITIGGIDIRDFDIHALRSKFGVVSQQPTLFSRSFEENIRYNTEASKEQMRNAAKHSNALSFIEGDQKIDAQNEELTKDNNKGFNRVVGVKGLHISGGQKQRVAIARAILRNPQILLLDEATSALDAQNEQKIQYCLDSLMNNKTTITVAHRFETIKNSERINVLEAGKIVEQGTYEDLLKKRGYFYNLSKGHQIV